MSFRFFAQRGLIFVRAEIEGPIKTIRVRLALDTAATNTFLNPKHLIAAGCDPAKSGKQVQFATGAGPASAKVVYIRRLEALGVTRNAFPVLAPDVPVSSTADGLLGLDFLGGLKLEIDFRAGTIELT